MIDGPWGFDQLWVVIALVGWAASFLVGILYFEPEGERIATMVEERGPADAEAARRLSRLNVVDRFQVLVLFTVAADMVIKPVGGDEAVLAVGAAILATAALLAIASISRGAGEAAPAPSPIPDETG